MKLAAAAVSLVAAAAIAAPTAATHNACQPEASFRLAATQLVYAASFLTIVNQARALEKAHLYDVLHRQFASEANDQPSPVAAICGASSTLADAYHRGILVRAAIIRMNGLIAGFSQRHAASAAQWRPVYAAAIAGTTAAIRLGGDLGTPPMRIARLQGDLSTLKALRPR